MVGWICGFVFVGWVGLWVLLFVGLGYCRFVCVLLAGSGLRRVCGLVGMHWFGFAGCYGCGVNLVVWVL